MVNDEFDNMDIHFMKLAIGQAKKAAKINEVPIGCVIVYDGKIIGRGYNRRNTDKTTLGHAEITAIKKASRYMQDWRADLTTQYQNKAKNRQTWLFPLWAKLLMPC